MNQSIVSKNHNGFQRQVICADANDYLRVLKNTDGTITSLPDWDETNINNVCLWEEWFIGTVRYILSKLTDDGYAFFYQSDRKYEGKLIDKSYLCNVAARQAGAPSLIRFVVKALCWLLPMPMDSIQSAWKYCQNLLENQSI